ncbi:MAG TPA: aconitate hydratase, partial [Aquificae bacterium]|nr:aconitate hydratase [Aquificota bacterium]
KKPTIRYFEPRPPMPDVLEGEVLIKVGDNITTDHIIPGGAKILPLRSNIPAISQYTFSIFEDEKGNFAKKAQEKGGGFIVGGENYGQGSSREHAAICPMYLGVKAVLAKSFARIHRANLINFGIVPFIFKNKEDYDKIDEGDTLVIDVKDLTPGGITKCIVKKPSGEEINIELTNDLSQREVEILKAGGILNYVGEKVRKRLGIKE